MRIKRNKTGAADGAVMMSPLIDCVFLLLIFFLATSQLKRWERQIPVTLADPAASLSVELRSEAYYMGVNTEGRLFHEAGRTDSGVTRYEPVENLEAFLRDLVSRRGADAPVELVVEPETPFQLVIDVLDELQHRGLTEVSSRVRNGSID